MSSRRSVQQIVITYPEGCREISEDLGSDELIRRLKTLAHTFQNKSQGDSQNSYSEYAPLANYLANEYYLTHSSRDVQLLVACCIADLLRIFAPDAPYRTADQIKTIFYFLIKQLGGLKDPKDPAFKRYFYLLENLAIVKSFNMCMDLEECNDIFLALFHLMFHIVNDEHSSKVKSLMLDVLSPLIVEADFLSNELLDAILINIVDPNKSQRKNAARLARDLIAKSSTFLEPYIQQFFNQVLILGKADTKLAISKKVFDLIYELNQISPNILVAVLPQLEFKLKSTDEADRMGAVSLLARMFSEKPSDLAKKNKALWNAFLGRYNDISLAIRIKCVQYTMHFLLNHPELHEDITETLKARQHDSEEAVRYEVVMAIVSTARKDFNLVARNESLLNFVKERTLDKKFKIRKEALSGLARIYKIHLSDPNSAPEATKKAVTWIKDKILHGYYRSGLEDKLLVEKLVTTCLVPFSLESEERMKKLFLLFSTIDEHASKAFIEIQKNQLLVRKALSEFLVLHSNKADKPTREILTKIQAISKFLPDSVKAMEFLKQLSTNLFNDPVLLNYFERVTDPDVSCKDCQTASELILKKLGSPIMTNLYYGTVKSVLERASSLLIDRDAIQQLTKFVKEALVAGPIVHELGVDADVAGERGLRLLMVMAYVFPSHFLYQDIIKELLSFLSISGDQVGPLVLSILTLMGRKKPIGNMFPELLDQLVPICKVFIRSGTAKQAKHAVKCLFTNTTDTQETVFTEILDQVKDNLTPERGEAYCSAIVALGHIAFNLPEMFPIGIKNIVSRKIVKELIMKDHTEARSETSDWDEFEDLPLETRCKIEGMKMMARWLTGLKTDVVSAQKTFRMLNAFITCKGDLLEEGKPNSAERAALRLAAGCAMLKICETKDVGDVYSVEQFYSMSTLVTDSCREVRERFLIKLHKGLIRGLPYKCLPLDFMGFYSLVGMEEDKKIKDMVKQYIALDIMKRRECIRSLTMSGSNNEQISKQLPNIMPDYMLVFSMPVLAHWPGFKSHKDLEMLKKLKAALWFILEPLMMRNDAYSYGFYKALVDTVKMHKDALHPNDEGINHKLWALCDLAIGLLVSKSTKFEFKDFPTQPVISPMFFRPHEDPVFVNADYYIPAEMIVKPPKKLGITLQAAVESKSVKNTSSGALSQSDDGKETELANDNREKQAEDATANVSSETEDTGNGHTNDDQEQNDGADNRNSNTPPPASSKDSTRPLRKRTRQAASDGQEEEAVVTAKLPHLSSKDDVNTGLRRGRSSKQENGTSDK